MGERGGPGPEAAEAIQQVRTEQDQAEQIQEDPVVEGTAGSFLFALGLWLLILYAVVGAFEFRPAARTLPHIAGIPSLVVATILVGREAARWRRRRRGEGEPEPRDVRAEVAACGWFAAYGLGVLLGGFAVASVVFMVVFLRGYGRERWLTIVLLTLAVVGVIVGVFDGLLDIRVYGGWLPSVLGN